MPVKVTTKNIYDGRTDDDGQRVLVTRYWPRGIKKTAIDVWIRDLGPTAGLIKKWKSGAINWKDFKAAYLEEHEGADKKEALAALKASIKKTKGFVTLLCTCREEAECHRGILKDLLKGRR